MNHILKPTFTLKTHIHAITITIYCPFRFRYETISFIIVLFRLCVTLLLSYNLRILQFQLCTVAFIKLLLNHSLILLHVFPLTFYPYAEI